VQKPDREGKPQGDGLADGTFFTSPSATCNNHVALRAQRRRQYKFAMKHSQVNFSTLAKIRCEISVATRAASSLAEAAWL
jgi:hypothetical protein